ncbi:MAG TPA: esterase-like activity of phytase family protein [Leucothrix mucor]|nr:esterase-like activity of phytase family protein [Leucothrix mucor]
MPLYSPYTNLYSSFIKSLILTIALFLPSTVLAKNFAFQFIPEGYLASTFMNIKNISSLGISNQRVDGLPITEVSGLAWDEGRQLLYAVSDSGVLYHIKLTIKNNKLRKTKVIKAYQLKDKKGKPFKRKYSDSEGLSVKRNANGKVIELIISFERKFRIARFNLKGKLLAEIKLPKKLTKRKNYQGKNKGLESVTLHSKFGIITAAERPLKNSPKHYQTLYSTQGKVWHFKQLPYKNISVTGLESLANGDILVLERAYSGLFSPMIIALRQVKLSECNQSRKCKVEDIAVFNSIDGWRIDNFEGLTHFKGNQFLIASDDNNSPLQSSALVLFEIK